MATEFDVVAPITVSTMKHKISTSTGVSRLIAIDQLDDEIYRSAHSDSSAKAITQMSNGMVFAQALEAATMSAGEQKSPVSFHGIHVHSAINRQPINFYVISLQNQPNCCSRQVEGRQNGRIVFTGIASFVQSTVNKVSSTRSTKISTLPRPNRFATLDQVYAQRLAQLDKQGLRLPVEIENKWRSTAEAWNVEGVKVRPIEPQNWFGIQSSSKPMCCWVRFAASDSAVASQSLYAFLLGLSSPISQSASATSQTVWFHQNHSRASDWFLCEIKATGSSSSRPFINCSLWTADGELIATAARESTVMQWKSKF
ncbi:Acyl-CoA thioesterase II [Aphelenchoides besseyi]|nr:Acyl-CoA thioesterase II [Aphelenchoides besseyi]